MDDFGQMFPPELFPPNAGMFSMIENDLALRTESMIEQIKEEYDGKLTFAQMNNFLQEYGIDYWILPQYSKDRIDEEIDIIDK